MNGRNWRVVTLHPDGEVDMHYGEMIDEAQARRVHHRHASEGAVLQHQQPPIVPPWVAVDIWDSTAEEQA